MKSTQSVLARVAILVVFAAYAVPLVLVVMASFKSDTEVVNYPTAFIFKPTLSAYATVLNKQLFIALGNSLAIAGVTAVVTTGVACLAAYALARMAGVWSAVIIGGLIALQMTPTATAVIPQFRILASVGLLGTIPGVILAMTAAALPYAILILRPFYLAVPVEVEESAAMDGAGLLRTFFFVVFPLARNGVSLIAVLLFIGAWGEFLYPISFLKVEGQFPLSVLLLEQQGFYGTQWNNLMALAIVGAIPTIAIFALVARRLTSGLALGVGK